MKTNRIKLLLIPAIATVSLMGCKGKTPHFNPINEIEENSRIFEVNYDRVNYDYGDKFWADNNDNWGGGCSAVTKKLEGHRIIGRNMDLNIADKAAYIVRTNESEGRYKTMGLAYTFREYAPYYSEVKEKGITDEFKNILPFLCDDVMNDKGLHIEVNMRHAECDFAGNDQFSLKETNPGKRRVHMFELPRYIAEHCTTVEEAKNYVLNELDIYSKYEYWNYCFIIADSDETGARQHATLLEFSEIGELGFMFNDLEIGEKREAINWLDEEDVLAGKVNWLKTGPTGNEVPYPMNALAQTNFFVNEWAYYRQDIKSGEGRFMTMQNLIGSVNTKSDMYDLMRRISYSYFYEEFDKCAAYHFDPRSENLGEFQGGTYDFIFNENYQDLVKELLNAYSSSIREMDRKAKMDDGTLWESTFTEVVDVTERNIEVRFFENEGLRFKITFDGIEHLSTLETKGVTDWSKLPAFPQI